MRSLPTTLTTLWISARLRLRETEAISRLSASPRSWSQHSSSMRRPVAEGLGAAVWVHGQLTVEVEGAGQHFLSRGAAGGEAEVLHQHQLDASQGLGARLTHCRDLE